MPVRTLRAPRRDRTLALLAGPYPPRLGAWVEQSITMDMAECSEEATALIDTRDGSILLVHEFPHC